MSTTSLKLSEEIKQDAAALAREQGVSVHAFMVDAIRTAIARAQQRSQFVAEANEAHGDMLASGEGYDADEVHAYLTRRIADRAAAPPAAKPWRR